MRNWTEAELLELGWGKCLVGKTEEWQHPVLGEAVFDFHTACEATERGVIRDTSNQAEPWKPTEQDKSWQRAHYQKMSEGGVWEIPATGGKFRVYPIEHRVVLIKGDPEQGPHDRIIAVTEAMGWTMEMESKDD